MSFHFDLSGRAALVTGASSGLGRHFARVLAKSGARVIVGARRIQALEELCRDITRTGGDAHAVVVDVTDPVSVREAVRSAALVAPIDILINNAGVTGSQPFLHMTEEEWDQVIDTNLKGNFLVAQAVAREMTSNAQKGCIINVASILGLKVAGNISAYAASKAAVIQLTRAMALELARYRIRVNALCPGYIETDLNQSFLQSEAGSALVRRIPQRRLGHFEDLDGALLLLCSDAASYITGSILAVDGGHLVSSL